MIEIKVNEQSLTLPPGIKLQFELVNSAFDFENIAAGLVWNFDLPADENGKVLDYCHFIDIKNKRRAYDATVVLHGKELSGKLVTTKTGSEKITCSFVVNGFPVDALDKRLPEVISGGVDFIGIPDSDTIVDHANDVVTKTYPEVNYNFPSIINSVFYGSSNDNFWGVVNFWAGVAQSFMKNQTSDSDYLPYNNNNLSPQLYLVFVLKNLFSYLGYTLGGSFVNNAQIKKVLLYNNYALDKMGEDRYMAYVGRLTTQQINAGGVGLMAPAIIEFNDDTTGDFSDLGNAFNTSTFEYNSAATAGMIQVSVNLHFEFAQLYTLGQLRVSIYVDSSEEAYNTFNHSGPNLDYSYTFATVAKTAAQKVTVRIWYLTVGMQTQFDPFTITGNATFRNLSDEALNAYNPSITYSNHVPDVTVRDFIVAIRKFFNLRIDYNPTDKTVRMDFCEDVLDATTDDLTTKALKSYEIDVNDGKGYKLNFTFDNDALADNNFINLSQYTQIGEYATAADLPTATEINQLAIISNNNSVYVSDSDFVWQRLCDNYYDIIKGSGGNEIITAAAPLLAREKTRDGVTILAPAIEQSGSSAAFDVGLNNSPIRLFIWHGLYNDSGARPYPFASSYNYDYEGNLVGDLSLRLDEDTYGLYKFCWSKWIPFLMNTETIIRNFNLNINDAFNYLFSRKKSVRNVEHIVKKLTIEVSSEKTEVAEAELCKIL